MSQNVSHRFKRTVNAVSFAIAIAVMTNITGAADNPYDVLSASFHKRATSTALINDDNRLAPLSLQACLRIALKNNLQLQIDGYSPAISLGEVVSAEAAFDAVMFASGSYNSTDEANLLSTTTDGVTTTTQDGISTEELPASPVSRIHEYNYQLGLRKQLPTGATIEISENYRHYNDITNSQFRYYSPLREFTTKIQLTQPLLRNFGIDLNRANINAARNRYQIELQDFELSVVDTIRTIETIYWQLWQSRLMVIIYQDLHDRVKENQRKLDKRRSFDVDITIIKRNAALYQQAVSFLLSSKNQVSTFQDRLLVSLNDPQYLLSDKIEILPTDTASTSLQEVDRVKSLETALMYRPEVIAQTFKVDTSDLAVGIAKNQTLPALNLLLSSNLNGFSRERSEAYDIKNDLDYNTYSVGIQAEIPIGNRDAKAKLSIAKKQRLQQILNLKKTKEEITADMNISINDLNTSHSTIKANQDATAAYADAFNSYVQKEDANAALTAGFLNQKIDAVERLATSQRTCTTAILNYNVAVLNFHRAQGTLLRYNNIKLAELPK